MSYGSWNNRLIASPSPILQISGKLDRIVPVDGLVSLYGGWGGAPGIEEIMKFWSETYSDSLINIDYDKFVIDYETSSKNIISDIGLNWENEILKFHENNRAVETKSI